jgi:bacterioferritin-associated ferredoxin
MAAYDIATDRVVCHCLGITESEIRCSLMEGTADCLRSVMQQTEAGTGCTACHRAIKALIAQQRAQAQRETQCDGSGSSPTWVTR